MLEKKLQVRVWTLPSLHFIRILIVMFFLIITILFYPQTVFHPRSAVRSLRFTLTDSSIALTVAFKQNLPKIMCEGFTWEVFFFLKELFQISVWSHFFNIITLLLLHEHFYFL